MEQPKKPPRSYKGLKQKQKAKISDYMYLETLHFFQAHGKMPDIDEDYRIVALEVSKHIPGLRIPIEEIYGAYVRKCPHIVERLTASGLPEHIRTHGEIKELQRIRAERKVRKKPRRKRPHQEPDSLLIEQDDTILLHCRVHVWRRTIWCHLGANGIRTVGEDRMMAPHCPILSTKLKRLVAEQVSFTLSAASLFRCLISSCSCLIVPLE
jgi:hypothetical protein